MDARLREFKQYSERLQEHGRTVRHANPVTCLHSTTASDEAVGTAFTLPEDDSATMPEETNDDGRVSRFFNESFDFIDASGETVGSEQPTTALWELMVGFIAFFVLVLTAIFASVFPHYTPGSWLAKCNWFQKILKVCPFTGFDLSKLCVCNGGFSDQNLDKGNHSHPRYKDPLQFTDPYCCGRRHNVSRKRLVDLPMVFGVLIPVLSAVAILTLPFLNILPAGWKWVVPVLAIPVIVFSCFIQSATMLIEKPTQKGTPPTNSQAGTPPTDLQAKKVVEDAPPTYLQAINEGNTVLINERVEKWQKALQVAGIASFTREESYHILDNIYKGALKFPDAKTHSFINPINKNPKENPKFSERTEKVFKNIERPIIRRLPQGAGGHPETRDEGLREQIVVHNITEKSESSAANFEFNQNNVTYTLNIIADLKKQFKITNMCTVEFKEGNFIDVGGNIMAFGTDNFGGDTFNSGGGQQEEIFLSYPECMSVIPLVPQKKRPGCIVIEHVRHYGVKKDSAGKFEPLKREKEDKYTMASILYADFDDYHKKIEDANNDIDNHNIKKKELPKMVDKLYKGMEKFEYKKQFSTSSWKPNQDSSDLLLSFAIQWLAASKAGVESLNFYCNLKENEIVKNDLQKIYNESIENNSG